MLKNKVSQLRSKEGFTIIEVIIVLVIAAVIMLMVFLVVPQLQRNQRNTRRQNDARRVLAATTQYVTANYLFPSSQQNITDITGSLTDPAGTAFTITYSPSTAAASLGTVANGVGKIVIHNNSNCASSSALGYSQGKVAVTVGIDGTPSIYCVND